MMVMVMVMAKREDQVLQLEKGEKNKKWTQDKSKMIGSFCFATQDTIEGVSEFRIDSRTMKRRKIMVKAVIKCH
jgi:hypothetical protein